MIAQFKLKTVTINEDEGEYLIDMPEIAKKFWDEKIATKDWFDEEKEHLVVLVLNTKLKIKGYNLVSVGTINECVAHPREILRPVIGMAGYAFILMHNHPTGEIAPSAADQRLTRNMKEACNIMQIQMMDHVITGGNKYFSFREAGCI